jgi:ribosome-associated protein
MELQHTVREVLAHVGEEASVRPVRRRATKPTYSSKLKRLEGKTRRSGIKAMRGKPVGD